MCACVCTHVRTAVVGEHDCVHKHLYHLATTVTGTKARMSDLQQKTMEARTRKGLIQERLWSVRLQRIKTQAYSQETGQKMIQKRCICWMLDLRSHVNLTAVTVCVHVCLINCMWWCVKECENRNPVEGKNSVWPMLWVNKELFLLMDLGKE